MSDDLQYIQDRIPNYHGYADEEARHDSDVRVRAILGESLTDAHVRLGKDLTPEQEKAFDDVVFHCMFGDQTFIRRIEHAELTESSISALLAGDRRLVEIEEAVNAVGSGAGLSDLVAQVAGRFAARLHLIATG